MKRIVSLLISVLLLIGASASALAAPAIAYDGTTAILSGTVDGALANEPVTVLVLKPNADGTEADISNVLNASTTAQYLSALEYAGIVKLDDAAAFPENYKIFLKDTLPSGVCGVYVNYLGQNELVKIGTFKHVNAVELGALVASFNVPTADYATILTTTNVDMLKSVGIDDVGYSALSDKSSFYSTLKAFAPFEDGRPDASLSAALNFSNSFNHALALRQIAEDANTLTVLGTYNGNFWNVAIDTDDDFTNLDSTIQTEILAVIKSTPYANGTLLSDAFAELTGVKVLENNVFQNGDVDSFLNNYWSVFDFDLSLYSGRNDYDKAAVQTYILNNKSGKTTHATIKQLYYDAVNSLGGGSSEGGSSSSPNRKPASAIGGVSVPPVVTVSPELENAVKAMPFTDVPSEHWSHSYVSRLYKQNIVSGKSETSFNPGDSITREEFVKIVVEALDLPMVGFSSFADVKSGAWYLPYVNAAVYAGIINGKGDGTFGIGDKISRQDAAVIISRAANLTSDAELAFSDKTNVSDYAKTAIAAMVNEGIITGYEDKSFKPKNEISRAESCAVICRLLDKRGGLK